MIVLGLQLGIESTLISPPGLRIWGLTPKQFMAVPVISIMIFAGFVIAGIQKPWMAMLGLNSRRS